MENCSNSLWIQTVYNKLRVRTYVPTDTSAVPCCNFLYRAQYIVGKKPRLTDPTWQKKFACPLSQCWGTRTWLCHTQDSLRLFSARPPSRGRLHRRPHGLHCSVSNFSIMEGAHKVEWQGPKIGGTQHSASFASNLNFYFWLTHLDLNLKMPHFTSGTVQQVGILRSSCNGRTKPTFRGILMLICYLILC